MITAAYALLAWQYMRQGGEIENMFSGVFIFGCMDLLGLLILMAIFAG